MKERNWVFCRVRKLPYANNIVKLNGVVITWYVICLPVEDFWFIASEENKCPLFVWERSLIIMLDMLTVP